MAAIELDRTRQDLVLPRRVPLRRVGGPTILDAELQHANERIVAAVVEEWKPLLQQMRSDDAGWNWAGKAEDVSYGDAVEHVVITYQEQPQGIMITSLPDRHPRLSLLPVLLYVEYLATAPWNRPTCPTGQVFKAVGPVLLKHAVRRSAVLGRGGRIGLHSEPGATVFYQDSMRLRALGPDPDEPKRYDYFEGDASWAEDFLDAGK